MTMVKRVFAPLLSALLYQEAANRYATGLLLERLEDDEGAFDAFHDAADAGFAPAQRKLGDIFARGNGAVDRDPYLSLCWYRKARDAGEQVPPTDFATFA
jgi:TPR repeat protein